MCKAEEGAYKAYPYNGDYRGQGDSNSKFREAYINGYHQAEKDVLDAIEKELTRRMLEDYNLGVEEDEIERDEIAQGCMASLIMFVRQMKEE